MLEEILRKSRNLGAKIEKEKISFDVELKELQRMNENACEYRKFMEVKSKCRTSQMANRKRVGGKQASKFEVERNLLAQYEAAFKALEELLGEKDVDKIVDIFKKNEAEISRTLEYVNVNNSECSKIEEEIHLIEAEKVQALKEIDLQACSFQDQIMQLNEEHKRVMRDSAALMKSLNASKRCVDLYLKNAKAMFSLMNYEPDSELDFDLMTAENVEGIVRALEQRVDHLVNMFLVTKCKQATDRPSSVATEAEGSLPTDSALSEDAATVGTVDDTDDLPSVGEINDEISVDSGNISQPISETQLRMYF
ncbi:unnamed protein product [Mesocestoides corti]|uniref:ODAD1 central coiled coil region domain-containing protein n=1 Tax=Mesocestoides corti TaxID=53468 RepID=A0A0R3UP22_MESCO|nr:unnamed protein product [Mesocestoides corti]